MKLPMGHWRRLHQGNNAQKRIVHNDGMVLMHLLNTLAVESKSMLCLAVHSNRRHRHR